MSIREIVEKIKSRVGPHEKDLWLILMIILIGFLGYGLGRLGKLEEGRVPVKIVQPALVSEGLLAGNNQGAKPLSLPSATVAQGKYVASKSGSKYHLPWCAGAKRIKEENKVWFDTAEAAKAAGYSPAANCPGL